MTVHNTVQMPKTVGQTMSDAVFVEKVAMLVMKDQRCREEGTRQEQQRHGGKLPEGSAAKLESDRATRDAFTTIAGGTSTRRIGGAGSSASASTNTSSGGDCGGGGGGNVAGGSTEISVPFRVLLELPQVQHELVELTKNQLQAVGEFVWRKAHTMGNKMPTERATSGTSAHSSWQSEGAGYKQFVFFLELIDGVLTAKELAIDEAADAAAEAAEAAEEAAISAAAAVVGAMTAEEERRESEDAFTSDGHEGSGRSNGAMLQSFKSKKGKHAGRGWQQYKKRQEQTYAVESAKRGGIREKRKTKRQSLMVDMGEIYGGALQRDSELLGFSPMAAAD
jgi:hypothetical protein